MVIPIFHILSKDWTIDKATLARHKRQRIADIQEWNEIMDESAFPASTTYPLSPEEIDYDLELMHTK